LRLDNIKCYNNHMKIKAAFGSSFKDKIGRILNSKKNREQIFEELEEILVLADMSMGLVEKILENLRKRAKTTFSREDFSSALKAELRLLFAEISDEGIRLGDGKNVIMVVGINGSGKTTSTAKLAYYFQNSGMKVLLAACDTFRAAGASQLNLWGERLGIPVIKGDHNADPGSVAFNGVSSLKNKDYDLLIIDTAGRVQTKENLMKELEKLRKIVEKQLPEQPVETLLVIDATMGQNTLDQAKRFAQFSAISGIILAKIDGTARGGTIINILHELKIPVKFAGTGETETDMVEFSSEEFIDALLSEA